MLVTELGMVTEVRLLQPWKAELPMLVTELGMVTEVKSKQYMKAPPPIRMTEYVFPLYTTLLGIIKAPVGGLV